MLSGWLKTKGIRKFKVKNKGKNKDKDKGTPVQRFFTLRHFEEPHPSQAASHAAATFVAAHKSKRDSASSTRNSESSYNVRDVPNTCSFLAVPRFELRYEREQIFYSMGNKPKPLGSISLYAHSVVSFVKQSGKDSAVTFEVNTGMERLRMTADQPDEAAKWVNAIRSAIEDLSDLNAKQPVDLSGVWRSDGKSVEGTVELAKALGYGPAKRLMFTNRGKSGFTMEIQQTGRHCRIERTFKMWNEEIFLAVDGDGPDGISYRFKPETQLRTGYSLLDKAVLCIEATWERHRHPLAGSDCYCLVLTHWRRDQNGQLAAQRLQERYFRHVRDVLVVQTLAGSDSTAICTRTFWLKENPSSSTSSSQHSPEDPSVTAVSFVQPKLRDETIVLSGRAKIRRKSKWRSTWSEEIRLELVQRTENFLGVTYTTSVLRWPTPTTPNPRRGDVAGCGELAIATCTEVTVQSGENVLSVQTGDKQEHFNIIGVSAWQQAITSVIQTQVAAMANTPGVDLSGYWRLKSTTGLHEFFKALGTGVAKRSMLATRLSKRGKFFITIQQTPQGVIHFRRVSTVSIRPRWVKVGHPDRAQRFAYYLETAPHYEKNYWSSDQKSLITEMTKIAKGSDKHQPRWTERRTITHGCLVIDHTAISTRGECVMQQVFERATAKNLSNGASVSFLLASAGQRMNKAMAKSAKSPLDYDDTDPIPVASSTTLPASIGDVDSHAMVTNNGDFSPGVTDASQALLSDNVSPPSSPLSEDSEVDSPPGTPPDSPGGDPLANDGNGMDTFSLGDMAAADTTSAPSSTLSDTTPPGTARPDFSGIWELQARDGADTYYAALGMKWGPRQLRKRIKRIKLMIWQTSERLRMHLRTPLIELVQMSEFVLGSGAFIETRVNRKEIFDETFYVKGARFEQNMSWSDNALKSVLRCESTPGEWTNGPTMLMYLEGGSLVMVNRFRHATMTSVFAWQSPAPEDAAKLPKKVAKRRACSAADLNPSELHPLGRQRLGQLTVTLKEATRLNGILKEKKIFAIAMIGSQVVRSNSVSARDTCTWTGGRTLILDVFDVQTDLVIQLVCDRGGRCLGQVIVPMSTAFDAWGQAEQLGEILFELYPLDQTRAKFQTGYDKVNKSAMDYPKNGTCGFLLVNITITKLAPQMDVLKSYFLPPLEIERTDEDPTNEFSRPILIEVITRIRIRIMAKKRLWELMARLRTWENPRSSLITLSIFVIVVCWAPWYSMPLCVACAIAIITIFAHHDKQQEMEDKVILWNHELERRKIMQMLRGFKTRLGGLQQVLGALVNRMEKLDNMFNWSDRHITTLSLLFVLGIGVVASLFLFLLQWVVCVISPRQLILTLGFLWFIPSAWMNNLTHRNGSENVDAPPGRIRQAKEALLNLWRRVPNEREMIHRHICSKQRRSPGEAST